MPTFVVDGPSIPEELIQSLEDDNLIIFCGAGISMGAGLPSFKKLVLNTYKELGDAVPNILTKESKDKSTSDETNWEIQAYDRMLWDLENRFGASAVRESILRQCKKRPKSLELHKALLKLTRIISHGKSRLVTTNFDNLFERAAKKLKLTPTLNIAPLLPQPHNDNNNSWCSIVHLHGHAYNDKSSLVYTSADFGRAYLTEGWARRFVIDLFRNFNHVLFIGYSLADPTVRYLIDAIAAERKVSKISPSKKVAYILLDEDNRKKNIDYIQHSGIEPIFYNNKNGDHALLKETIIEWAKYQENRINTRAALINRYATKNPASLSSEQIKTVIWAINGTEDIHASSAGVMATLQRNVPFEWIEKLEEHDAQKVLSGIQLVAPLFQRCDLNPVQFNIAKWLCSHYEGRDFIKWFVGKLNKGTLNPLFKRILKDEVSKLPTVKDPLKKFWMMILSNTDLFSHSHDRTPFFIQHIQKSPFSHFLIAEIDKLLQLRIVLERLSFQEKEDKEPETVADIAYPKISFVCEESHIKTGDIKKAILANASSDVILLTIFSTLERRLEFAIQILGEFYRDPTDALFLMYRPSIKPHDQNSEFHSVNGLIDLLWVSWQKLYSITPDYAVNVAKKWLRSSSLTFQRMGLAALTDIVEISPANKLPLLLRRTGESFLGSSFKKESLEFVEAIWPSLKINSRNKLTKALKVTNKKHHRRAFEILTLLKKKYPKSFKKAQKEELDRLRRLYPDWRVVSNEQAYFSVYSSGAYWANDPKRSDYSVEEILAMKRAELKKFLLNKKFKDFDGTKGAWEVACSKNFKLIKWALTPQLTAKIHRGFVSSALYSLRKIDFKPADIKDTLNLLIKLDERVLIEGDLFHAYTSTFSEISSKIDLNHQDLVVALASKIFKLLPEEKEIADKNFVQAAINSLVGHVTEAILKFMRQFQLKKGAGIPDKLLPLIKKSMSYSGQNSLLSRTILASRLYYLFTVDKNFATNELLGHFDWEKNETTATAMWQGFCWSPTIDVELWSSLKSYYIQGCLKKKFSLIGEAVRNYYTILALAGIEYNFSPSESRKILEVFPPKGRVEVLYWLEMYVGTSKDGKTSKTKWQKLVYPWLKQAWPKDQKFNTPETAEAFARLLLVTEDNFQNAFKDVESYLQATPHWGMIVYQLLENPALMNYPETCLKFVAAIFDSKNDQWHKDDLRKFLDEVKKKKGGISSLPDYKNLMRKINLR